MSEDLPDPKHNGFDREACIKAKREAKKRGSVAKAILENARVAVMVHTMDSLVAGVTYATKLDSYAAWFSKERTLIRTRSDIQAISS